MSGGPRPHEREERRRYVEAIAEQLRGSFGTELACVAVYGSVARGTDGPYSDIEMICAIREGGERDIEWAWDGQKVEVWLISEPGLLREAARLGCQWPLTHGAFIDAVPLHDPERLCDRGRALALGHTREEFDGVLKELIVGEMYERIAKIRGMVDAMRFAALPQVAVKLCENVVCLVGLANARAFSSIVTRVADALACVDQPEGFEDLANLVIAGDLSKAERVVSACERQWSGVMRWAAQRGIEIEEETAIPPGLADKALLWTKEIEEWR